MAKDADLSDGISSEDNDKENDGTGNATEDEDEQGEEEPIIHEHPEIVADEDDSNFDIEINEDQPTEEATYEPDDRLANQPFNWTGFKLLGDNFDKNVRPSYQRSNKQTVSLHFFHALAVSDRIDFSALSDAAPHSVVIDPCLLLPTAADVETVKKEFQVFISRFAHQS